MYLLVSKSISWTAAFSCRCVRMIAHLNEPQYVHIWCVQYCWCLQSSNMLIIIIWIIFNWLFQRILKTDKYHSQFDQFVNFFFFFSQNITGPSECWLWLQLRHYNNNLCWLSSEFRDSTVIRMALWSIVMMIMMTWINK